jgi:acetyltransferase-like isoleucine patch superfamily enzyme
LGKYVYIASGCIFLAIGKIEIGDEAMFGPYVNIPYLSPKLAIGYFFVCSAKLKSS